MNYNQFSNLSCYEEFEIQCTLTDISKLDVLKIFEYKIDDYYFFISNDGIFNWNVINIGYDAFWRCESLKEVIFKGKTLEEVKHMKYYPWDWDIIDESIIKCEI